MIFYCLLTGNLGVKQVRRAQVGAGTLERKVLLGAGVLGAQAVNEILQRCEGLRVRQISSHSQQLGSRIVTLYCVIFTSRWCANSKYVIEFCGGSLVRI